MGTMKIKHVLLLIVFLCITFLTYLKFNSIYIAPDNKTPITPTKENVDRSGALDSASINEIFKSNSKYQFIESNKCLSIGLEDVTSTYVDVVVREVHEKGLGCSGDSDTSPVRDRYRILIQPNQILKYDVLSNGYFYEQ